MNIKTIGMNTSLKFQWLIEPQSMKQRETPLHKHASLVINPGLTFGKKTNI
jgi:hypothetical protein